MKRRLLPFLMSFCWVHVGLAFSDAPASIAVNPTEVATVTKTGSQAVKLDADARSVDVNQESVEQKSWWQKTKDKITGTTSSAFNTLKRHKIVALATFANPMLALSAGVAYAAQYAVSAATNLAIKYSLSGYRPDLAKKLDPQHSTTGAQVTFSRALNADEAQFRRARFEIVKAAQQEFLGMMLEDDEVLMMAGCGSGGGMRALFSTLGFLVGAETTKLYQTLMYMAGLSGSTWTMCPLMFYRQFVDAEANAQAQHVSMFRQALMERAGTATTTPLASGNRLNIQVSFPSRQSLISDVIWPRAVFSQPASSVGIYGALLANALLWFTGDERQRKTLSQQAPLMMNYQMAFYIYTAVATYTEDGSASYVWYELTPYEVRDLAHEFSVPVWSFGRRFDGGSSQVEGGAGIFAPEQPAAFLGMAIPGSAFTVSMSDILPMMKTDEGTPTIQAKVALSVLEQLSEGSAGDKRFFPATLFNPVYNDKRAPQRLSKERVVNLIDAGISGMNLPVPPLLKSERGVQVIFLFDASAGDNRDQLKAIREYARTHADVKCPEITDAIIEQSIKQPVTIIEDENDPSVPILVYLPLIANPAYKSATTGGFDPKTAPWCSTYNFNYSAENIAELTGLTEFTMKQAVPAIQNVLRARINRGRQQKQKQANQRLYTQYESLLKLYGIA